MIFLQTCEFEQEKDKKIYQEIKEFSEATFATVEVMAFSQRVHSGTTLFIQFLSSEEVYNTKYMEGDIKRIEEETDTYKHGKKIKELKTILICMCDLNRPVNLLKRLLKYMVYGYDCYEVNQFYTMMCVPVTDLTKVSYLIKLFYQG